MKDKYYNTVIIGAGASGLYCACALEPAVAGSAIILEKTKKAGTKLLMSGSGQCNITHGGTIKDFISHYGDNGRKIRSLLQKYSNLSLRKFIEDMGLPLMERDDGKVFPASMSSKDVLRVILQEIKIKNIDIEYDAGVNNIEYLDGEDDKNDSPRFAVYTPKGIFRCHNLVIATGGASYPSTGSDGKMFEMLSLIRDVKIIPPKPSLTPVYTEDYRFGELSGISFDNVGLSIRNVSGNKVHAAEGSLLFTRNTFSGPVIINNSRYMDKGTRLEINFIPDINMYELVNRFKKDFPGNKKSPHIYLSDEFKLPKRFLRVVCDGLKMSERKVSQLTGKDMEELATALTCSVFIIEKVGGFNEAMATCGGVSLENWNPKTSGHNERKGLYFIGEVLDIDGDTGGYNLQFAYSSARAAAADISAKYLQYV